MTKHPNKYGVFIVNDNGICVRCFNRLGAANGWLDKHCKYLSDDEKQKRIWTFNSRNQVKRFFNKQILRGCVDKDVIACMCYYCGVATRFGLDLKNGKIKNTTLS